MMIQGVDQGLWVSTGRTRYCQKGEIGGRPGHLGRNEYANCVCGELNTVPAMFWFGVKREVNAYTNTYNNYSHFYIS